MEINDKYLETLMFRKVEYYQPINLMSLNLYKIYTIMMCSKIHFFYSTSFHMSFGIYCFNAIF